MSTETNCKKGFHELVKPILKKLKENQRIGSYSFPSGRSQYTGCVFWAHVNLPEGFKLKDNYSDVTGFNIMPYRITEIIVDNACLTDKKNHPFNKGVKSDNSDLLCDFDVKTGNFHVNMNKQKGLDMQIVLTEGTSGPGLKTDEPIFSRRIIKDNYYFPRIDSYDKPIESETDLQSLIAKVISEVQA